VLGSQDLKLLLRSADMGSVLENWVNVSLTSGDWFMHPTSYTSGRGDLGL
jgi:hypothetical protein